MLGGDQNLGGLPAYTARESRVRPAGWGIALCSCAAVCFGVAAAIAIPVWLSPEFAADFDSGAHTARVSSSIGLAAGLLVVGAFAALTAIVRGGGHRVRPVAALLLLLGCPAVAVLTLPLLDYYH